MGEVSSGERSALFSFTLPEWEREVERRGGKPFHARIVRRQVIEHGARSFDVMTGLSKALRAELERHYAIDTAEELAAQRCADRTTKLLLAFPPRASRSAPPEEADGARAAGREETAVETVHIPPRDPRKGDGATLCVSTQVGCPVACPFCASGLAGLVRNLAAHEIVEQYVRGSRIGPLKRSVVMGIGEPLLNFEALTRALDIVHDEFGLGARKITVSTVGFPERLRRIAPTKPRFQLAISLHTPDDEQRDELVPAMAGVPIDDVLAAGDDWFEKTGREITYEYVLLAGTNDSLEHARRLGERLRGRRCTVNLIPFNPVDDSGFRRPNGRDVEQFQQALERAGVVATVRWSRGVESDAACGQLRVRQATRP